jgi:hypothetical protein
MVWQSYLAWACQLANDVREEEDVDPELQEVPIIILVGVYKRYIKFNGQAREDLIRLLLDLDRVEDVLPIYEEILSLLSFRAKSGKSKEDFERELSAFISKYPDKCFKLKNSPVLLLRSFIEKHKTTPGSQISHFWISLSEFFTRTGEFGMARDIFEEALALYGIQSVTDFSLLFTAYL